MTPRDSSAAADANPNASPPRSPDGLGERLRELVDALPIAEADAAAHHGTHGLSTHSDEVFRERAAVGWRCACEYVEHNWGRLDYARETLDRFSTLTEQAKADEEAYQREAALVDELNERATRLRSENTRLTEQVRGAEGVVEAARPFAGELEAPDRDGFTIQVRHSDVMLLRSALSIYDEGAGGRGRSGSASPAGDGVSGVDAAPTSRTEAAKYRCAVCDATFVERAAFDQHRTDAGHDYLAGPPS